MMMFYKKYKSEIAPEGGFTLIEILVASAIASLILLMVYSAYATILKTVHRMTGYAEFYENVNLAVTKINKDISNAYYKRENKKICFIAEVKGENSKINFVTVIHKDFNVNLDPKKPCPVSDIKEVGYFLEDDKKIPGSGIFLLMKREDIHFDDDPENGGEVNRLLENVVGLKFEFKEGNDWTTKWDSRQNNRFPQAVRTTITVKNYQNKEEEFIFISYINVNM